jgi:thiamine kinase-like enzyme
VLSGQDGDDVTRHATRPAGEQDHRHLLDRVPGWAGRARVLHSLEGGITNRNLLVDVDGERFVLRLTGVDTHLLGIDREVERIASTRAADLGVAPEVFAFIEPERYLVTRFVPGDAISASTLRDPDVLAHLAPMLRAFHESGPLPGAFDCFRIPETSATNARARGVTIPGELDAALDRAREIEAAFAASPEPRVPCHNDLLNANFLRDIGGTTDRIWLLDWEYAGMNERSFDLGNFSVNNELDDDADAVLLTAYFGAVTPRRLARLALMKIMSDLREAMWGVVQQGISTLDFDYVGYAAKHFDRLLGNASAPGYRALLDDAAVPDPSDPMRPTED